MSTNRKRTIEEILKLLETPAAKAISPDEMRKMFKESIRSPNDTEEGSPVIEYIKSLSGKGTCDVLDLGRLLELVLDRVKER